MLLLVKKRPHPGDPTNSTEDDDLCNPKLTKHGEMIGKDSKFKKKEYVRLRVLLCNWVATKIIGQSGANINRLRSLFHCRVYMGPVSEIDDRVMDFVFNENNLETNKANCLLAIDDILSIYGPAMNKAAYDRGYRNWDRSNEAATDLRILLDANTAPHVIGLNAAGLRELRKFRCGVFIYEECCPGSSERVLSVSGVKEDILQVLDPVIDKIKAKETEEAGVYYEPYKKENFLGITRPAYGGFIQNNDPLFTTLATVNHFRQVQMGGHTATVIRDDNIHYAGAHKNKAGTYNYGSNNYNYRSAPSSLQLQAIQLKKEYAHLNPNKIDPNVAVAWRNREDAHEVKIQERNNFGPK